MSGSDFVTEPFCEICGDPIEGLVEHVFHCSFCRRRRPPFDLARSAVRYRGSMRELLQAFKYGAATHLSVDLTGMLGACVDAHYSGIDFDAVTFVPLYPRRERDRTYNQARLLARGLARRLGVSVGEGCLCRIRATATQTALSAAERRSNVSGAFLARNSDWLDGRCMLLVDDVMTTGATVAECARVLREAGAAAVYVVTVARG